MELILSWDNSWRDLQGGKWVFEVLGIESFTRHEDGQLQWGTFYPPREQ